MKFFSTFLMCSFLFFINATAQGTLDDEVNKMANMLNNQLNNKKDVTRVAVADFIFNGQKNTEIGIFLADKIQGGLLMNGAQFNLTGRKEVRTALSPDPQPKKTNINIESLKDKTIKALNKEDTETRFDQNGGAIDVGAEVFTQIQQNISSKKLKSTDVIIYGSIVDKGEVLQIFIEGVTNNKKVDNVAYAEGKIIKTPDIVELMNRQLVSQDVDTPDIVIGDPKPQISLNGVPNVTPFKHKNLTFEAAGCYQTGKTVECKLNIISSNSGTDLSVSFGNTRILDANGGYEFHVNEIKLADVSATNWRVAKTLVADVSIEAVFRFADVNRDISSIAQMQINCQDFIAQLDNIPVE